MNELIEDTKETLANLENNEQDAVREAFDRSLDDAFELLTDSSESFGLGKFEEEIKEFADDFRSVLHHPEAENTVEDLEDWLVAAGAGPFEEGFREELIEIVESDTETVDSAIETIKSALSSINDDGMGLTSMVARFIKQHLANVNSVVEIESIAGDLNHISNKWPYPWDADLPEPLGPTVQTQINNLLFTQIELSVTEADTLDQFTTLAKERILEINELLLEAKEIVSDLDELYQSLTDVSEHPTNEVVQILLDEKLEVATSVGEAIEASREVLSVLDIMNDVATESIDRFEQPSNLQESVGFLNSPLSRIGGTYRSLISTRKEVLSGDVEDYDTVQQNFSYRIEEAEDNLERLRNTIKREIKTGKDLSNVFELDEQEQALNKVELNVSRADSVKQLVEYAQECEKIRSEITSIITDEHLDTDQASVFEFIVNQNESRNANEDMIDLISNDLEMNKKNVLEVIIELKDEELVTISIEGS
ncbi:hypothetical protein [Halobacteriaceae bacterium SHR40]|uniref:hypothetical protein n=1 Tax=Halovenus amylolytica TaxID=2500550 RepID=UPI000FE3B79F